MIIQYGKRAGGKIWSTTAARKASARIIRKNQGPVAVRRFRSLKSRQRKRKRSIAKVVVEPTLVITCLNIKANLDSDGGHARTKTVQSKARQINEVVYLEIQFLPLLFALQLKCNLLKRKSSSRNLHLSFTGTCFPRPYPHFKDGGCCPRFAARGLATLVRGKRTFKCRSHCGRERRLYD